jgi:hypothetical protein
MIQRIQSWLLARNPGTGSIGDDDDLIDNRLIDSLGFQEFLLFLEEVAGREITLDESSAVSLRTLRGIRNNILEGEER